jgi:colicin import membrane protein
MNAAAAPAALNPPQLRPRSADSARTGVALSVLAHAGLIAALSLGVQWRSQEAAVVQAELWSAVPQAAAPPAPPPELPAAEPAPVEPPPLATPTAAERAAEQAAEQAAARDADIALERQRKQQVEDERRAQDKRQREELARKDQAEKDRRDKLAKEQAAKDKAAKEKAEKAEKAEKTERAAKAKAEQDKADKAAKAEAARKEAAEQAKLNKLRDEQMRRMSAQLGGVPGGAPGGVSGGTTSATPGNGALGSTGTAARSSGPAGDPNYLGRIVARIKPNVVLTDTVNGNPEALVEVRVAPDGKIIGRRLMKSSGQPAWDDAVLRAIDRTDMLPRRPDGTVPPSMEILFRPRD